MSPIDYSPALKAAAITWDEKTFDHLAPRRLGIEDAARGAHREHAPHADLARCGINADFDEVRAERRLLVLLVEVAIGESA